MTEREPKLVGYEECRCILQQYCDGRCRPIFEDADVVDEARVLYANNQTYRGTTPLPWHYAPIAARKEWVAQAKAALGVGASLPAGWRPMSEAPPKPGRYIVAHRGGTGGDAYFNAPGKPGWSQLDPFNFTHWCEPPDGVLGTGGADGTR